MRAFLISAGLVLLMLGLTWPWLARITEWLPFGNLPGDVRVERPNFRLIFPLGSSLLISIVLSLVLSLIVWLWRR
ncbi:MAG: DUF2905 domain-containing protein [Acetobacteraceae bacterium]